MPILDVELVCDSEAAFRCASAQAVADAAARVLQAAPGRVWVRLRWLPSTCYAENDVELSGEELPVFVTVLHARPPSGAALQTEVRALTHAIAAVLGRAPKRVHLGYEPAGAGRQAFGGEPVP